MADPRWVVNQIANFLKREVIDTVATKKKPVVKVVAKKPVKKSPAKKK